MIVIVEILLTLILPGSVFLLGENNKGWSTAYLQKRGYDPRNPVCRERLIRARHTGAIAYAMFVMVALFMVGRLRQIEDALMLSCLWFVLGRVIYQLVQSWSFKAQQFGKMDSETVLTERDQEWGRRPQPLVASDVHGSSKVGYAEENGLADADALTLGERGPQL